LTVPCAFAAENMSSAPATPAHAVISAIINFRIASSQTFDLCRNGNGCNR
jgi:hypothetical protein